MRTRYYPLIACIGFTSPPAYAGGVDAILIIPFYVLLPVIAIYSVTVFHGYKSEKSNLAALISFTLILGYMYYSVYFLADLSELTGFIIAFPISLSVPYLINRFIRKAFYKPDPNFRQNDHTN